MVDLINITLFNPHADDFVSTPVSFRLIGRKGLGKYKYLLEAPIARGQRVQVLVDGTLSSIIDQRVFAGLPRWLRIAILRVEIYFWLRTNNLAGKVDVHWSANSILDRTALYVFSYKNCVGAFDQRKTIISAFDHAIINLSHYFIRTREKAGNIAKLSSATLIADSDLSRNDYFKNFFPNASTMLVLPFAVDDRFRSTRPFERRSNKCAATGSFHDLEKELPREYYSDFISFFRSDTYHPVRKLLYSRRAELSNWLECRISPFRELKGSNSLFARLRGFLRLDVLQTEYFSFDIVDFYNQFRFAIVGEELSGAPAVGFFEAMACGCVMLGAIGSYYDGLGLKAGVHYLEHDGTVESIHAAIVQASENLEHCAAIASAGRDYVEGNCRSQAVWDSLQARLAQLLRR